MKFLGLWLIRAYQRCLSPLLPPACKYSPTCSHYTYQSIEKHGFIAGVWLGGWRLLRCNPWSHGGADPAPEAIRWTWHGPVRKGSAPTYDFGACECGDASATHTMHVNHTPHVHAADPLGLTAPIQSVSSVHRAQPVALISQGQPRTHQRVAQ